MKNRNLLWILSTLIVFIILFGIVTPSRAELAATDIFLIWDDDALSYENNVVSLFLDGSETHVVHEIGFDNDKYDPTTVGNNNPTQKVCARVSALTNPGNPQGSKWRENCPPATGIYANNKWTGVMELGIPRLDNDSGAYAFAYSLDWSLIDCDLNSNNAWNNGDYTFNTLLKPPMPPSSGGGTSNPLLLPKWDIVNNTAAATPYFKILAIDVETNCSTGNCAKELVTTIFMNLDTNGDGSLTTADGVPVNPSGNLKSGRVCFFARIFPIHYTYTDVNNPPVAGLDPRTVNPAPTAVWTGNPQARITAGGGDKTVNFDLFGPTAITLDKLAAQSPGGIHPYVWLSIFVLLMAISFILIKESRQKLQVHNNKSFDG